MPFTHWRYLRKYIPVDFTARGQGILQKKAFLIHNIYLCTKNYSSMKEMFKYKKSNEQEKHTSKLIGYKK